MAKSAKQVPGEQAVRYVSPRKRRAPGKQKMQPPLTPMIDVVFQLLIFFLIAFQIREMEGLIPASLPKAGVGQTETPPLARPIYILLRPGVGEGVLYEIGSVVTPDPTEVYDVLEAQKKAMRTDKVPVVIKPRGDVRWSFVVEAFNAAVRAKLKQVAFAPSG